MKQLEKCSGRGFDSHLVHQKQMALDTVRPIRFLNVGIIGSSNLLLMGQPWFRQGKEYRSGQLTREGVKTKSSKRKR